MLFDTGRFDLKPAATDALGGLAAILEEQPDAPVVIEGHTDNVGSAQSNHVLSENRVALLKPLDLFFGPWAAEPDDVFLVVEVSDTTIRYDTDVKVPLYAERAVREYWLLDIQSDTLVVWSDPADGNDMRREISVAETVTMGALPDFVFTVDEILD